MTTQSEILRLQRLAQRRQATANRLRDELKAAKALNQQIGAALNDANDRAERYKAQADLWRSNASVATLTDTRMDPLELGDLLVVPSLWQRLRGWVGL